jgi:hypothetical protein
MVGELRSFLEVLFQEMSDQAGSGNSSFPLSIKPGFQWLWQLY